MKPLEFRFRIGLYGSEPVTVEAHSFEEAKALALEQVGAELNGRTLYLLYPYKAKIEEHVRIFKELQK